MSMADPKRQSYTLINIYKKRGWGRGCCKKKLQEYIIIWSFGWINGLNLKNLNGPFQESEKTNGPCSN